MPNVSLDAIRQDVVDKKYEPTVLDLGDGKDPVVLVSALRIPRERRDRLAELAETLKGAALDSLEDTLHEVVRLVSRGNGDAARLIKACGGDVALLLEVVKDHLEATQMGEASPSAA